VKYWPAGARRSRPPPARRAGGRALPDRRSPAAGAALLARLVEQARRRRHRHGAPGIRREPHPLPRRLARRVPSAGPHDAAVGWSGVEFPRDALARGPGGGAGRAEEGRAGTVMTTLRSGGHGGRPPRTTARHCRSALYKRDSDPLDYVATLAADLLALCVQRLGVLAQSLALCTGA
jgi:hypothetical protein